MNQNKPVQIQVNHDSYQTVIQGGKYALQGLNFDNVCQIEYGPAKIKAKTFFLHRYLFLLVYIGLLLAFV